jgi:hypothetical protein
LLACTVLESSLLLIIVMSPRCSYPLLHTAESSSSPLRCHKPALLVLVLMPPLPSCTFLFFATESSQTRSHSHCACSTALRAHATLAFLHIPPLLVLMPPLPSRTRASSTALPPSSRSCPSTPAHHFTPCPARRAKPAAGSPEDGQGPSAGLTPERCRALLVSCGMLGPSHLELGPCERQAVVLGSRFSLEARIAASCASGCSTALRGGLSWPW